MGLGSWVCSRVALGLETCLTSKNIFYFLFGPTRSVARSNLDSEAVISGKATELENSASSCSSAIIYVALSELSDHLGSFVICKRKEFLKIFLKFIYFCFMCVGVLPTCVSV